MSRPTCGMRHDPLLLYFEHLIISYDLMPSATDPRGCDVMNHARHLKFKGIQAFKLSVMFLTRRARSHFDLIKRLASVSASI